ncbi:hypothetical protein BURKHO8Y_140229 [Burkholderia sp. 8Y]|nr:hypothetical protein BURKHO8Y_140229 [Burkholderia sp. 8Y]
MCCVLASGRAGRAAWRGGGAPKGLSHFTRWTGLPRGGGVNREGAEPLPIMLRRLFGAFLE